MNRVRQSAFARGLLLPLALLLWLSACHKWVPLETPYATAIAEAHPGEFRVTTADGTKRRMLDPVVTDDSVGGVPLTEVQLVEERRTDVVAIVGLVVGIGALYALGVALYEDSWESGWD